MAIADVLSRLDEIEQGEKTQQDAVGLLAQSVPASPAPVQQQPPRRALSTMEIINAAENIGQQEAVEADQQRQAIDDTGTMTKVADTLRSYAAGSGELLTQAGKAVEMFGRTDAAKSGVMMPEAVAGMDNETSERVSAAASSLKPGESILQPAADTLMGAGKTTADYWDESMSEGGKALSKMAWQDAPGAANKLHAAVLGAARSAPQTIGIGFAGKALTGMLPVAQAIPGVAKGLTRIGLPAPFAQKAAEWMATGAVYGTAEGISAGLSNAAQVGEEIDKMDFTALVKTSPKFNEYLAQLDQSLPAAEREKIAKGMLKEDAENMALWATAALSTATGTIAGAGIFDKALSSKRFLLDRALGGLKEAHQEFWQSGLGEKLPQNIAMQQADQGIGAMDNVWHEAVAGAGPGAIMGLVAGGGGRGKTDDQVDPTALERNKVAAQIERMNLPTRDLIAIRNGEWEKVPYAPDLLKGSGLTPAHIDGILDNRANEMSAARFTLESDIQQGPLVRAATMATVAAEDAIAKDKARRVTQEQDTVAAMDALIGQYNPAAPAPTERTQRTVWPAMDRTAATVENIEDRKLQGEWDQQEADTARYLKLKNEKKKPGRALSPEEQSFMRAYEDSDNTQENRAAWSARATAEVPGVADRKMQTEWDQQEQDAINYLSGRFSTKPAREKKADPLAADKERFDESYNAVGTVPESKGNVTDEEAAQHEQKVQKYREQQRKQALVKSYSAQQKDDDELLNREDVPDEVKRNATRQAQEIVKSDPVYQHMAEAKKRGKLNLEAMGQDYDKATISMINRRYPGIFSLLGTIKPDDFASEMGYENLDAMVRRFSEARTQKELTAQIAREKMDEWQRADAEQGEFFQKQAERQDVLGYLGKSYTGKKTGTVFPAPDEAVASMEAMIKSRPDLFTDADLEHWTFTANQQARLRRAHQEATGDQALSGPETSDNTEQAQQEDAGVAQDATGEAGRQDQQFQENTPDNLETVESFTSENDGVGATVFKDKNTGKYRVVLRDTDAEQTVGTKDFPADQQDAAIEYAKKLASGEKVSVKPPSADQTTIENAIIRRIKARVEKLAPEPGRQRELVSEIESTDAAIDEHLASIDDNRGVTVDKGAIRMAIIGSRDIPAATGAPTTTKADLPGAETVTAPPQGEASQWQSKEAQAALADRLSKFAGTKGVVDTLRKGKATQKEFEKFSQFADDFEAQAAEAVQPTAEESSDVQNPRTDQKNEQENKRKATAKQTNDALLWLQTNETVLPFAEIKDKQAYIDTAAAELALHFAEERKKAVEADDQSMVEAVDEILTDGKVTLPEKFFETAYKSAIAKVKQEAGERAIRRSAERLEGAISDKKLTGEAADNFREGWNHAMAGKSRSSLRMNDKITEGYDAARAFLKTPEGQGLRKKDQKKKLEGTGIDLVRSMDKKRSNITASSSTEEIVKQLMAATNRADLFRGMASEEATPGAQRLVAETRGYFRTFGEFVRGYGKPLYYLNGEYISRKAGPEVHIKAYLDMRVHRIDGNQTLKEETREQRLEVLKEAAKLYTETISAFTSKVKGENVKDLAISITDNIIDSENHRPGVAPSSYVNPAYKEADWIHPLLKSMMHDASTFTRSTLVRVNEFGDIVASGRTVAILLEKENDEDLKRKSGKPLMAPKLDKVTRSGGKDHRKGRDITPEEFKKTFGFIDVGFGDYVAAQEDQDHLNYSYDAFMDLADLLGIPPKAMSVAGNLYFSIGNLGHGKASAHYNPAHPLPDGSGTVPVINVTNTRGDGTVSHEWAHAFDITTRNMAYAFSKIRGAMINRAINWPEVERLVHQMLKGDSYWTNNKGKTATKAERIENALGVFDYIRRKPGRTKYFKDALALDGVKTATANAYWSNDAEILARGFEAWVADKLESLGQKNTYLVNPEWVGDGKISPETGHRGTPYPTGEERKLLNKFFDAMVDSLVYNETTGEVTLDGAKFTEKMPDLAAEARKKWDEYTETFEQMADEIEREQMAKIREEKANKEMWLAMKVGDIVEPMENSDAVEERLGVSFPATIVGVDREDNAFRKIIKVIGKTGAEVQMYASETRIVTAAEDVVTSADLADLPAESTAPGSGKLSDAELEDIFNDALNEVQEQSQEKPDEPPPGTGIASDLKLVWTKEDIQEIRDHVAAGKVVMVGDRDLGIPTIHDFPSGSTTHHGYGAFTVKTDEYIADFDAGGLMIKTVGGRSYTIVGVRAGSIPFYNQQAVLDHLDGLLGAKKQTEENNESNVKRDFDALVAGKEVNGYSISEKNRSQKNGGKTWVYGQGPYSINLPADGVVWTREHAAVRVLLELNYPESEVATVVHQAKQPQRQPQGPPPSLDKEQEKTVKNLASEAAKLGVEGIDEALTGLVKLFGGGKSTLMSFPAGFDEEAYQEAKPHFSAALKKFQDAGKSLKDLFAFLIKNFGAGIKPYALRFAKDQELTKDLGEQTSASKQVATFVAQRLETGPEITWQELFAKADEAWGGTQAENKYTSRDAYDAMEMGVNLWLRKNQDFTINQNAENAAAMVRGLTAAINKLLPTQTKRTKEQIEFQQFSTPPSLAYVANWVAKVGPHDVMMEPSAGTGDLAIWSEKAGATLILNELSSRRAGLLRELFPNASILTEDGLQLNNILPSNVQATVVVMNPPFSSTAGRTNTNDTMNGAKHLEQALKRLAPGGRLVAIVGEGMGASKPSFQKWWNKIQEQYNVRANISINGAEYAKYGTTFDNQLIVIDNTGKTTESPITVKVNSVSELPTILEAIRNDRQDPLALTPPKRPGEEDTQGGEDTIDQGAMDASNRPDDAGAGAGGGTSTGMGGAGELPGSVRGPGGGRSGSGSKGSGGSSSSGGGSRGGRRSDGSGPAGTEPGGGGDDATGGVSRGDGAAPGEISVDDVKTEREGELTDAIFEPYKPQRLSIPGAKDHPGPLVQSAAMASVEPPAPTYTPNLPKEIIDGSKPWTQHVLNATTGKLEPKQTSAAGLSLAQLEAIVYAGQAHGELLPNGERRGFFIGDNTGVGKGREISGIILDNFRQGRKRAVWVSKSAGLLKDAQRDFGGIGGNPGLIFSKPNSTSGKITQKEGVLFITYDSLKTAAKQKGTEQVRSRMDQVLEWLGPDFDGVIAFDEAHAMGNAIAMRGVRGATTPSKAALAGVDIQKKATNARVVYVSATGATEVKNLSYATRLGLWGANTPFADVVAFINNIVTGGVAAMEMVARDMKALGSYIARSLSFDGVEYRTLRTNLSALNVAKYDELAKMWQIVLKDINAALDDTGGRTAKDVKKNAMGAFWGAQQRFFNQVITAMQTPAMIEDAKKQLAEGKSVVVQLTNHYGDQAEREVAKAKEAGTDLEELDLTPRQMLEQFLRNSFPTQQYEEQVDDAGNTIMVPVLDSEGKPVHNADAIAARDALIEKLQQIAIPGNPIDTIIEELGKENVAEVTGRKKRYLSERDGKGGYKVVEDKRGSAAAAKEAAEFQDGKRRVLIFSGAGATGFSFHADNTANNKQQRIHYVLQPGWRADTAVQGFGRTHRTNQASTPEYVLVTTDVQAQKRFVSSIARRLDQLGALTKGQRETSGGLFNASDNLESKYAHAALQALFTNMHNGYTTLDFNEVIEEMGLTNLVEESSGRLITNNLPEMTKFLNRLLSLTIDRQNEVFSTFYQYLDEIVNRAIEQGTYDSGLQTIKAKSIKKVRDEVVFTDERTGAKTRFVEVDVSNPVRFRDFETAQRWAKSRGEKFAGWFKGPRTKIFGLVDLGERLDNDGRPFNRGEVIGIVDGSKRHVDNVIAIRREVNGYQQIKDEAEAKAAWEKAVEEAPVTSTERKHMLVGVLMPIWNRIEGAPTIFRMQEDGGEVLLGRLLTGKALQRTMRNLGVDSNLEGVGAQQILAQIDTGATAILANGWSIQKRRVSNENRIEITKARGFTDAEINILTGQGAFHEVISWTDRVFIPTGSAAQTVFENITKANPVVEIEGGSDTSGTQSNTQLSKAQPVPAANRADIEGELRTSLGGVRSRRLLNSGQVVIVDSQEEMQGIIDGAGNPAVKYSQDGAIQGAYVNGVSYLVRDGIAKGQAFPVLLHELGEHANQLGFSKDADYKSILKSLENRKDAKGATGDAIRAAMAKVPASTKPEHYWSEVAAYLIEQNANTELSIIDRIKAFFKKWLVKAGLTSPDTLTHKDLVLFARAAVNSASGGNVIRRAISDMAPKAANSLQFSRAMITKIAGWTKKRIDNEVDYAAYFDGRTKAVVGFVNPADFVKATTPSKDILDRIYKEAGDLDVDRLTRDSQSPYLKIEHGVIQGHEGRHRMAALHMAGVTSVPVVLDYGSGAIRKSSPYVRLIGQRFQSGRGETINIVDTIPVTFDNQKVIERIMDNARDVRFSLADVVGPERAAAIEAITEGGYSAAAEQEYFKAMAKEGEDTVDVDDVALRTKAADWFKSLIPAVQRKTLGALTLRQLRDVFAGDLPQMEMFYQATRAQDADAKHIMTKADEVYNQWAGLSKKAAKDMSELMIKATIGEVNPDLDQFEPRANSKALRKRIEENLSRIAEIKEEMKGAGNIEKLAAEKARLEQSITRATERIEKEVKRFRDYNELAPKYRALSKEAKDVYQSVKKLYVDNLNDLYAALEERISRQITDPKLRKETMDAIRLKYDRYLENGPYFPLSRFGEYITVATNGGRREVRTFDSMAERTRYMRRRRREGWQVQAKTKRDFTRETAGASSGFVEGIFEILDKTNGLPGKQLEELKDQINQHFIKALPDLSHRKHFVHREKVEGYSRDQMRAFADNMQHAAHHIARIRHADKLETAVQSILQESKMMGKDQEGDEVTDLYNELNARLKILNNPDISPVAQALTAGGFVMNIGPSIASALVNMSQTPLVAFPILATRFKQTGAISAMNALKTASADYFTSKATLAHGPDLVNNKKLPQAERDMIQALIDDGTIDVTAAHSLAQAAGNDFFNMARTKHGHAAMRAMRLVSYPFHIAELANRKVTALAAYRLAIKNGMSHQDAINETREIVLESHFDYSQANRARWMEGNVKRVLLLFKQYSQQMTWLLGRSFYLAAKGESPEVKAMAKKRLAMILGGHFLLAGMQGMPVLGGIMAVVQFLFSAFGDDDDPKDLEVSLRNLLTDTVGKTASEAIASGPWRMIPGLGSLDLSSRVSLGDLWFRAPEREAEGRDKWNQYVNLVLGPVATNASNIFIGAGTMADGQVWRGIEMMLPKFLKDAMKSVRYSQEGVKNWQEDTLIDNLGAMELFGQALGFTPANISEMYSGANAIKNHERRINDRRQLLINRWVQATRKNDAKTAQEAMENITEFNQKQPLFGITGDTLRRSYQGRIKAQSQTKDGVYLPATKEELRKIGRFANI